MRSWAMGPPLSRTWLVLDLIFDDSGIIYHNLWPDIKLIPVFSYNVLLFLLLIFFAFPLPFLVLASCILMVAGLVFLSLPLSFSDSFS